MLKLTPVMYDSGNVRLYVKDEYKRSLVILDHGIAYKRFTGKRFELCTMSKDGEPNTPLNISWVLTEGVTNTGFKQNLSSD